MNFSSTKRSEVACAHRKWIKCSIHPSIHLPNYLPIHSLLITHPASRCLRAAISSSNFRFVSSASAAARSSRWAWALSRACVDVHDRERYNNEIEAHGFSTCRIYIERARNEEGGNERMRWDRKTEGETRQAMDDGSNLPGAWHKVYSES